MSEDDLLPWTTVVAAAVAAVAGVSLSVFQLDVTSRFLLNPLRLQSKRHSEYKYRWTKYLEKAIFFKRKQYNFFNDTEQEQLRMDIVDEKLELQKLIHEIVSLDGSTFDIVAIEKSKEFAQGYNVDFVFEQKKYQAPLVDFGLELDRIMQDKLTSTAFCIVADASSGYGSELITTLVKNDLSDIVSIVPPESSTFWMTLLADLAANNEVSKQHLERILYGLCRLEALRFHTKARTVLFEIPGQACVPQLLPLLQQAFPCERHLFIYSGCVSAVKYEQSHHQTSSRSRVLTSTPMSVLKLRGLPEALAKLPLHHADTVETWMTAVDAYFKLKDNEKKNNYLPFCCKLDNLMGGSNTTTQELALTNVLQFITGSKSRPLSEQLVDAAMETLRSFIETHTSTTNAGVNQVNVQNCVFNHKSILIENKTLVDTVTPSKEWTLKSAKRISGCLCCAPEEEEDEEEQQQGMNNTNYVDGKNTFAFDPNNIGAAATTTKKRPNYVDGKTTFAFDPSKF